jgi:cytochrome c peroxidase
VFECPAIFGTFGLKRTGRQRSEQEVQRRERTIPSSRPQNFSRFQLWILLSSLLMVAQAHAQVPVLTPEIDLPADHEPITAIPPPPEADPRKVALGEHLFDDPRLSHDGRLACSSCHEIQTNGASKRRTDTAEDDSSLPLNTPTLFNAALSFRLNWEGNEKTLEEQAESSLDDPRIMATNVVEAIQNLTNERGMTTQFRLVYGHGPDRGSFLNAIATYEQSLVTPGSRFDQWLGGDQTALSAQELSGYRLFKSLGCVSCHQGANVGGNLFERSGIFHGLAGPPRVLRVPSLRNVAVTAPYFHDGSVPTLEKAVHAMGYAQLDRDLSDEQVKAVAAFLNTLTGFYQGRELTVPP